MSAGHTPGPWVIGRIIGQHVAVGDSRCRFCDSDHKLVSVGTAKNPNGKWSDETHQHLCVSAEKDGDPFDTIISGDGTEVVGMYDYEIGGVCTGWPDARLIAAVPDLLDTAKDLLAHLDLHLESMRKVVAGIPEAEESLSYIDGAMSDSLASARIVIAKATGSAD